MFAASCDPSEIFAALSASYTVTVDAGRSARWVCLDTADWRLRRAGMELRDRRIGRSNELVLTARGGERIAGPSRTTSWPRRIDAVAPAQVRDRIAPVVGVRALLPLAEVDARSVPLRLLDHDSKTRVRVWVDQQSLSGDRRVPLPLRVIVSSLRGYERDAERCARILIDAIPAADRHASAVSVALHASGHRLSLESSEPELDPDAPVIASLATVLLRASSAYDAALSGVLADVDTEFLHDLRTSVRATRSVLSLAGRLLPGDLGVHFSGEFAWVGTLTSRLRDLDVYLLELAGHGAVDVAGLGDLAPLRRYLISQRRSALRALRQGLLSTRGTGLGVAWRASLERLVENPEPGPRTGVVAGELAVQAYRRVRRSALGVGAQPVADELHTLRRRGKKMRYVLEGFSSVYEASAYRSVLADLKQLQDCLGEIQDSDVQYRYLIEVAGRLSKRGAPVDTILAMGALQDRIAHRETRARRDLDVRVRRVCANAMKNRVRELRPTPQ